MNDIKMALGAGMKVVFDGPLEAITAVADPVQGRAMAKVEGGNILRFDAVQGHQLVLITDRTEDADGHAILEDKWYGTFMAINLVVGPFERKSQAMNGLALTMLGLKVEGIIAEETKQLDDEDEDEDAERVETLEEMSTSLTAQLITVGVPEKIAADVTRRAMKLVDGSGDYNFDIGVKELPGGVTAVRIAVNGKDVDMG